MISYPSGGLNQMKRPSVRALRHAFMRAHPGADRRSCRRSFISPWCRGAEHGVDRPRELPRRRDARHGPAEPRFLCEVVVREPTVRRVLHMRDARAHERAAEPAIGPPRNRPMVHRAQPGLPRRRDEARVARQVPWGPKAPDRQRLRADDDRTVGADPGNRPKQLRLRNRSRHLRDASIEGADQWPEPPNDAQVTAHEGALLEAQRGPRLPLESLPARAREEEAEP